MRLAALLVLTLVVGCSRPSAPTPTAIVSALATAPPTAAPVAQSKPTAAPPTAPPPTQAPQPPTSPPAPDRVRVTGTAPDGLNLRAEPSSGAARVKIVKDGSELEIAGPEQQAEGRTWRKVRDPSDAAEGYAAAQFLTASTGAPGAAPAANAPTAAAAAPNPPTAAPKPAAAPTAPPKPAPGGTTCGSYASQQAAQAAYRANPSGLRGMDADGDGIACEGNPPPKDLVPVRR